MSSSVPTQSPNVWLTFTANSNLISDGESLYAAMLETVTDKRSSDVMTTPPYKELIGWNGGVSSDFFLWGGEELYRTIEVDKQCLVCG